jgi:CHAT domain-containing protein
MIRNKFKTILFITSLFLVNFILAQDKYDKLKTQVEQFYKDAKYDSALVVAKQMNNWTLQNETDTSLRHAVSLRYVGNCFQKLNIKDSALFYWFKSLKILEYQKREFTTYYSKVSNQLGVFYWENDNYKLSERYYRKTLLIDRLIHGDTSIEYAKIINNLGVLYEAMGDYDKGDSCYLIVEKIFLRKNGLVHEDNIKLYQNMGGHFLRTDDLKNAEIAFKKCLQIIEAINNKKNIEENLADTYNNLSLLYKRIGDKKLAVEYAKKSITIYEKTYGKFDLRTTPPRHNLANYIENCTMADSIFELLFLVNKRNNIDSINIKFADILFSYGKHKFNCKEPVIGESLIDKARNIYETNNQTNHRNYAIIIGKIGDIKYEIGDYFSAEKLYNHSLEIKMKICGENHQSFISTENDLALALSRANRVDDAYRIFHKNFFKKSKQIADNFEWLSDNQKETYWKKESSFYDKLSSFANQVYLKVPEAKGLNYNSALVTKSKMLESKISSENYYREVDELREELAYRRRLLAKMESEGSTEKEKFEKLRIEADSLDKRLTLSWPEYAQQKKNLSITWEQVQQNLDQGEAAIEFVRFKNEDDSLYYYNALVLKKGDINPTLIKLCKEEALTAITPKMGYSAYYPIIWQPLESALVGIKTIYYAPTGELYNIPFHAIYAPKGKGDEVLAAKTNKRGVIIQNEKATTEQNAEYLMDRYTLHQLTSTRYLAMGLKQKEKEKIGNNMAMVGGVNYDYLPGTQSAAKKNKKNKNVSRSSESASGKLAYLEGTTTEVEQISSSVTPNNWQATLLENNDATEEKIIQMENKEAKSILHIATHGYAFPEYNFNDTTISKNSLRYSYRYSSYPMVRSGLILAGGNWAWTGSDTLTKLGAEQNGILTALEVSQLNLKKTKLVVLSACETGLGKIEGSEGTFGLKRGFKLAGVEQMIVSLWSVPDKETMELMTLFYSDLTKSLNPVTSFEKAQKEMRNKYPSDPEKWAGFVLVR